MIDIRKGSKTLCSCGCGFEPTKEAYDILNVIATDFKSSTGKDLLITSGARCQAYNKKITGAVSNSSHTKGLAFDAETTTSNERYVLIKILLKHDIKRIGINFDKSFVHFDIDLSLPNPVIFKY